MSAKTNDWRSRTSGEGMAKSWFLALHSDARVTEHRLSLHRPGRGGATTPRDPQVPRPASPTPSSWCDDAARAPLAASRFIPSPTPSSRCEDAARTPRRWIARESNPSSRHTETGRYILSILDHPGFEPVSRIVYSHFPGVGLPSDP